MSVTVVGPDGKLVLKNHIFRTKPGTEGAGAKGQLSLDMSPTQPHTNGKARTCESCHASPKALGYGISGGRNNRAWNRRVVVDLMTADRKVLPKSAITQIEPIAGLTDDWSRIVTQKGKQLQTVGHHWPLSRPLNNTERAHMSRQGICLSCHRSIPKQSLAVSLLHHVAKTTGQLPKTRAQHDKLVHKVLITSAWTQVLGGIFGTLIFLGAVGGGFWWWRRRWARPRSAPKDADKPVKSEPPPDSPRESPPPAPKTPPGK